MAYDLLIKNGRVVDGTGGPSYYADVAIQNGKIVGVGRFNESAARVINADGRVVAPGFIDHHTHYDPQALYDPLCSSTAQNGNTTVIVGQCGQVLAPARPGDHDWYMEFFSDREDVPLAAMRNGIDFSWESIAGYMDALGRKRGVNAGILIGHSGVRRYVMGEEASHRAESTPEEIEAMRTLVRDGILAGALGFSTGAGNTSPCGIATDTERFALAGVLGELGTGVFQIAGGSDRGLYGPLELSRDLSLQTGRPSMYNLISQQINAPPDEWKDHLNRLEESFKSGARAYGSCLSVTAGPIFNLRQGLDTAQDEDLISPHIMFQGMSTWDSVMSLPVQARMQSFRDAEIRASLTAEAVEGSIAQGDTGTDRRGRGMRGFNRRWDLVEVFMTYQERNRKTEGKSIEQLAQEQGKGVMDAFLDLSLDEDLRTHFICVDRNIDVESQRQIMGSPYTVIGTTDGGARPDKMDRFEYSTRLLSHWVREKQVMTLEDAVYRMTGKTALMHDLDDIGFIAPGKTADITIFDPDTIDSKPREPVFDFPDPTALHVKRDAVGIDYVIVNGEVLLENNEHTGALPGRVIRGPLYQSAG